MQKIIVIEDSNLIRMRITKTLQQGGYSNVVGLSNAEAVRDAPHLFLSDADLVISDIVLPGISGVELTKSLGNHSKYCNIPIILISSCKDMKTINEAIKAGAVDYLVKPFEDHVLIERVKKVIGEPLLAEDELEKIKTIISLECERAVRGEQPLSLINLKIHAKDMGNCIKEINSQLRKIDIAYSLKQNVIVILPLTNEKGLEVVFEKINKKLLSCNIEILEKKLLAPDHNSLQKADAIYEALL